MTRKVNYFWKIEMVAENILKHCEYFNKPYEGIDFMIESCKIDLIPLDLDNDKLLGLFGMDDKGNKFIGYNKNMMSERILFTKAHEFGHFVLEHKLKNELLTDSVLKTKSPQEREANIFAAALLMPRLLVVNVVKKSCADLKMLLNNDTCNYDELSQEGKNHIISNMRMSFHTSRESIEWRIRNLFVKNVNM